MKRWRKALGLFLTVGMLAGALSGCGNQQPENDKVQETKYDNTNTAEVPDDVTTYTIATMRWSDSWPTEFLHSGIMKELEDKHGIYIDWQIYYSSDWAEQKSLLLASGDLPDAFLGCDTLSDSDISQNKDYFVELSDLIDRNMPNYKEVLEKEPEMMARSKDRNGESYSLVKKLPLRPEVCGDSVYINKEWLDNLGLAVPVNLEELTSVLEAFAREDADGDGDPTNEIGITCCKYDYIMSGNLRTILAPFNCVVDRSGYMHLDDNGTPVFAPVTDNYKEAVKWMAQMYAEGVVDPEFFTQDPSMSTAKLQAEGGSLVGLVSGWTVDAQVGANAGQFIPLEAIEGIDGGHHVENASRQLDINDKELVITKNCKNPDKLLQWADDFYDDLVALQTFYGSIPDQVKDNGDGTYEVLLPENDGSLDTSAWSNSLRDYGPKYMNPEFYDKVTLPTSQGDGVKVAEDSINGKYVTTDRNNAFPPVKFTDEEILRLSELQTDLYKYVEAQYAHWVVDGGVEEEWDAYLEQLDAMGLAEFVAIQTKAYDFYLDSMK